jgi:sulfonate dioxygenase
MYFFARRVAQTALRPFCSKPYKAVRAYNFWFDPRTMAPSLEEPLYNVNILPTVKTVSPASAGLPLLKYVPGQTVSNTRKEYEHEDLKPQYPNVKWPALKEVSYEEKGLLGDPDFVNLKAVATEIVDYNPKIGTEVHGVDLTTLTDAQKNDIARLIAIRGVVFFRDQKNLTIEKQRELGAYFGILHKHGTTGVPKRGDLDDVHVGYTDENSKDQRAAFTPTTLWHSDVSQ